MQNTCIRDYYGLYARHKSRQYKRQSAYKATPKIVDTRLNLVPKAMLYLLLGLIYFLLKEVYMKLRKIFQLSKFMRYGLLIFLLLVLFSFIAAAQEPRQNGGANGKEGSSQFIKPLVVGQKMPEEFWTREHLFYHNGDTIRKSLAEYKGKMLILDFWMSGCSQCILHQREINHFKELHQDELAVIMVNSLSTKEGYAKIDKYLKGPYFRSLGIPQINSIIHDDYLQELLAPRAYPSYFWINKLGYLQLFTFRNLLDRDFVAPFIKKSS